VHFLTVISCISLLLLAGCATSSPPEQSEELVITKLPLTVRLDVDNKTKEYTVTTGPDSIFGRANILTLPAGEQLMIGIKEATKLAFTNVDQKNSKTNPVLRVSLKNLDFKWRQENFLLLVPYMRNEINMIVMAELIDTSGNIIYKEAFIESYNDKKILPATFNPAEGFGMVASDAYADLVSKWVRRFVEEITGNQKVRQFAKEFATSSDTPAIYGPEITVTNFANGSSTDQGEISLAAEIYSESPIKVVDLKVNSRSLDDTRAIVPRLRKSKVINLNKTIPLLMGENIINITAENVSGGINQKVFIINRVEPDLIIGTDIGITTQIGERWAVVVGISTYKNSHKGLQKLGHARNDALSFSNFLQSPHGGGFNKENIIVLIDEEATSSALRRALFTFLKKAIEEDLVIIFFSGQGAPEPGAPDNYYLLTYDADPEDLPATAIATWDINMAIQRNIKARRVVILADASYVSEINRVPGARGITEQNLINRYLKKLSETGEGKAVFTATQEDKAAIAINSGDRKTGLFTHYLLEALSGAADENRDNIVTLGETIDYTTDLVSAASRGRQLPDIAGKFDRSLPLAILQ